MKCTDPWREYRLALRRASEQLISEPDAVLGLDNHTSKEALTARKSLGGTSKFRGAQVCVEPRANLFMQVRCRVLRAKNFRLILTGVMWDVLSQAWRAKIKVRGHTWVMFFLIHIAAR